MREKSCTFPYTRNLLRRHWSPPTVLHHAQAMGPPFITPAQNFRAHLEIQHEALLHTRAGDELHRRLIKVPDGRCNKCEQSIENEIVLRKSARVISIALRRELKKVCFTNLFADRRLEKRSNASFGRSCGRPLNSTHEFASSVKVIRE